MALCALDGCCNKVASGSKYCSLTCAEKEIASLRKVCGLRRALTPKEIKERGYEGDESPRSLRALRNPYPERTAGHQAFEVFRKSGFGPRLNRMEIIDRLVDACDRRNITLRSPADRVKRVITETRARGFELAKDENGCLRLTGRRVKA